MSVSLNVDILAEGADEWMKSVQPWTFRAEPELLGMMDKWSKTAPGDTYAEHAEAPESDCNVRHLRWSRCDWCCFVPTFVCAMCVVSNA